MIDKAKLIETAAGFGVAVSAEQAEKLDRYAALLAQWNERMNLTAITDPAEMRVKHFADSLTLLTVLPDGARTLVDVGTGAGFPGLVAAIMRPDMAVTLLDSLQKRLTFLEAVCTELGVSATTAHLRAEDAGRDPAFREQFDVATARAVKRLPTLCEYALPLVKVGGRLIALKGPEAGEELQAAENAVRLLGGAAGKTATLALTAPNGETLTRALVQIDKIAPTPKAYPRPAAKIQSNPL